MEKQKKNTGLYILIIILCVLVLALGRYIIYDKNNKNNINSQPNNESNSNTNTINLISKLDSTKDWVYDAEYTKEVNADSYSTYNVIHYAKDIIVPYINVSSSYANTSNSDIKKVFDDAIKNYNTGVNDKMTYIDECNYQKYVNDNILSVILTYGVGTTDVINPKYYTYNIDLKTGNQLSYEETYKTLGLNSSDVSSKVQNAITNVMKEKMKDFGYPNNYPEGTNFDTYNNESINNYKNSVSNNTLKYFLSADGKLNVIVKLSIPAGTGEFDTIITVK